MKRWYLKVINEQATSIPAKATKVILILASAFYYLCLMIHKTLVQFNILGFKSLPVPVISIGNITVGGTGKTPCVEAVAKMFASRGVKVAIFSSGYGKNNVFARDDEELQISDESIRRFTNEKKYKIYDTITAAFKPEIILLDDGFQHWKLKRDFDIVLIDATNPFSNGYLLPAGLLREPLSAMKRAELAIITRTNQTSRSQVDQIRRKLLRANTTLHIMEAIHQPEAIKEIKSGKIHSLDNIPKNKLLGFCGIGNPIAFRKTLHEINTKIEKFTAFPDHHLYTKDDHLMLNILAREFLCDGFITTTKDSMRLEPSFLDGPLFTVIIQFKIVDGEKILNSVVERFVNKYSKPRHAKVTSHH